MLSEIVISAKDAKHISQLAENLRQDPRFELYAAQFSVYGGEEEANSQQRKDGRKKV